MPKYRLVSHPQRLLGLDIEAQHGATWSSDYDGRMFFGAAMGFDGQRISYLPPRATTLALKKFVQPLYEPNIIVVAHNGRYDLEGLNGELSRVGLPQLPTLNLSDTLKDTFKTGNMYSRSLGNLCEMLRVDGSKEAFGRYAWEAAYRGEKWALEKLQSYNEMDVVVVLAIRREMLKRGMLKYPYRAWRP